MGIQRGDRFDYIVSMSTPQRGLESIAKRMCHSGSQVGRALRNGDMNTSLIKTAKGLTITLKHDTSNPHPYDRINVIAGTKGVFADYPPRIYFDGQPGDEAWAASIPSRSTSIRYGSAKARLRRSWAATAAWTTSCFTG
jgi:hypothetical protein